MKHIYWGKNFKVRSRKLKFNFWYFAVFLLPLIIASSAIAVRPIHLSSQGEVLLAQDCRNADVADVRGATDPLIPYIISPRRTSLLSDRPKLRWNPVLDTNSYTVSLMKGEKTIWETTVNQNEIMYPGEPKLESNGEYLLVVKADNGKSSQEEKQPARGFKLLPKAEAEAVKTAIAQLDKQQTTDKTKALLRAYLYMGSELKYEAIETLEALIKTAPQEAALYRRLGELYWASGVTLLAEINYLEGVKKAIASGNVSEKAQIETALGEMYIAIGNSSEANRWLTKAKDSYKSLGNTQRVKELETQIAKLK